MKINIFKIQEMYLSGFECSSEIHMNDDTNMKKNKRKFRHTGGCIGPVFGTNVSCNIN